MKAGVQKESHRKYNEPEIEHACEKLRFILKKSRPQMGRAEVAATGELLIQIGR
jgi:hypothetical protein